MILDIFWSKFIKLTITYIKLISITPDSSLNQINNSNSLIKALFELLGVLKTKYLFV